MSCTVDASARVVGPVSTAFTSARPPASSRARRTSARVTGSGKSSSFWRMVNRPSRTS